MHTVIPNKNTLTYQIDRRAFPKRYRLIARVCAGALALFLGSSTPPTLNAADGPAPSASAKLEKSPMPGKPKRDTYPFRGKIASIDKSARTLTLQGKDKQRIVRIDDATRLTRDGQIAALDSAAVGEEVGGLLRNGEAGQLIAVAVRFGPPTPAETKSKSQAKVKSDADVSIEE